MPKENFLLVSLKESKAKKLAKIVSNESCRQILDFLSSKDYATETQIAKELDIPISTVHYNLKHLKESGLVKTEEFHYSEKGKEVNHYQLANKYIIIAPQSTYGIKEKLKSVLPAGLIVLATAGLIAFFTKSLFMPDQFSRVGTQTLKEAAVETTVSTPPIAWWLSPALWFVAGALLSLSLFFLIPHYKNR